MKRTFISFGIAAVAFLAAPAVALPTFGSQVYGSAMATDPGCGDGAHGWNQAEGVSSSAAWTYRRDCAEGRDSDGRPSSPSSTVETTIRASAGMGRLSAFGMGLAKSSAATDFPGMPFSVIAEADIRAQWHDYITVSGAAGTVVVVRMGLRLDDSLQSDVTGPGTSYGEANSSLRASGYGGDGEGGTKWWTTTLSDHADKDNASAGGSRTVWFEFPELAGSTFEVFGDLQVYFNEELDIYHLGTFAQSTVDAEHTMHGYFDIVNPLAGQTLSSASGFDYSFAPTPQVPGNSVPEPSALWLTGASLMGLLCTTRRRRS